MPLASSASGEMHAAARNKKVRRATAVSQQSMATISLLLFTFFFSTVVYGFDTTLNVSQIFWSAEKSGIFLGSPSLVRCPLDGSIVASYDLFGKASNFGGTSRSRDNGVTWSTPVNGGLSQMYWATLFTRTSVISTDLSVYAMGVTGDNSRGAAQIVIARSNDCGITWSQSSNLTDRTTTAYSTGPTPVLLSKDGRLWRAYERNDGAWASGYSVVVVSIMANATDLLSKTEWSVSGSLSFTTVGPLVPSNWSIPGIVSNFGWLEGGAVETPDNSSSGINVLLRVNSEPTANKAALVHLATPDGVPTFVQWVDPFPGGNSKFSVRRDVQTGPYVTLANNVNVAKLVSEPPTCGVANGSSSYNDVSSSGMRTCCSIAQEVSCTSPITCIWCHANARNVLTLSVSRDLSKWTIVGEPILEDDTGFQPWSSELFTGFQYVDWQFDGGDGDDLIASVRAAYRGANAYHNSNRHLFVRVNDWRSLLTKNALYL